MRRTWRVMLVGVVALATLLAVAGCVSRVSYQQVKDRMVSLEGEVADLKRQQSQLEQGAQEREGALEAMQKEMEALKETRESLDERLQRALSYGEASDIYWNRVLLEEGPVGVGVFNDLSRKVKAAGDRELERLLDVIVSPNASDEARFVASLQFYSRLVSRVVEVLQE
ncbi:MAG: hypothetical protein HYU29_05350 [Chloroflexi bacterium]|nr:hypothetical protein [Chloroflexota bacterium]